MMIGSLYCRGGTKFEAFPSVTFRLCTGSSAGFSTREPTETLLDDISEWGAADEGDYLSPDGETQL